jgi:hypothetical protein
MSFFNSLEVIFIFRLFCATRYSKQLFSQIIVQQETRFYEKLAKEYDGAKHEIRGSTKIDKATGQLELNVDSVF